MTDVVGSITIVFTEEARRNGEQLYRRALRTVEKLRKPRTETETELEPRGTLAIIVIYDLAASKVNRGEFV